jgi:uncharacterized integral membrane protein
LLKKRPAPCNPAGAGFLFARNGTLMDSVRWRALPMMFLIRVFRLWLGILIALYAVYLAINNTDRMVVQLPPFISHVSLPVYVVGAAFILTGCAIAIIFLGLDLVKKSLTIHQLQKKLRQFEGNEIKVQPTIDIETEERFK